jgi:hypothetical protein
MPLVAPFHFKDEADKPGQKRMHHTNDGCLEGQKIAQADRVDGTGGFRRCVDCARQDEIDALRAAPVTGAHSLR